MELTIKHLAAYLPYGLVLYGASDLWEIDILGKENICIKNAVHKQIISLEDLKCNYSPILRPLSMLDKEIEVNGERFIPIDWFEEKYYTLSLHKECERLLEEDGYKWINHMSYLLIIHLLEWHFDIFGLIDVGLAVEMEG
jgi:hypothetical protein